MIAQSKESKQKTRGILTVELGKYKAQWIRFCKGRNEKPGAAIRRIIAELLAKQEGSAAPSTTETTETIVGTPDHTRIRSEIRLTRSERAKLEEMAEANGLTVNQYLVNLARSHILRQPQFGIKELDVLSESNVQLLALGRNLNQIARALNAENPIQHRPTVRDIKALSDKIYKHAGSVSQLINANLERWQIK